MTRKLLKLYIDGAFVDAHNGETFDSINPATGETVARCAWAGAADANKAVDAARRAFDSGPWREAAPEQRKQALDTLAALLSEHAEAFAVRESQDAGALINKARTDIALGVSQLKYFGRMALNYDFAPKPVEGMQKEGRSFTYTTREPLGVCAQIIPWNFPITMLIWKIGPALATGNTLVLKCAPETPVNALHFAELCAEAGIPPGVVNIITGDAEAGEALVRNPKVDKVSFTGSTDVGRRIIEASAFDMKRLTLECGGKSANIVLDDADLSIAVDGSLYASFFHSGQVCESGTRLFLSNQLHDRFVEQLIERAQVLQPGDPMDPETTLGPVVSAKQMERVLDYIQVGKTGGAKVAIGGKRATQGALAKGNFIEPTIFTGVGNDMRIAREEIFGPVLSVLQYTDVDDAVRMANDNQYGLAGGVWSRDVEAAKRVAQRLRAGWIWINEWHVLQVTAPFGGYKQSGLGREFGAEGLNAYTEIKTIYQDDLKSREAKFWYDVVLPARAPAGA